MRKEAKKLTIIEALTRLDDGGAIEKLKTEVDEVVNAVDYGAKGAKGTVTLTLSIQKLTKGQVHVTEAIKSTKPKEQADGSTFFVHPEGGLTTDNPSQGSLNMLEA